MSDTTTAPRWFRPPRPHGQVVEHRTVSFLELFYDLVFVVLIAELAHTLAGDASWTGVRDFAVVFALVWIAWLNGTLYHDLHGGDDGRSRTYVFVQMAFLVLLAVFAAHAADDPADGQAFGIVYALLVAFVAWQWFDVRRFDSPEWRGVAGGYVAGALLVGAIVAVGGFADDSDVRIAVWALAGAIVLGGNGAAMLRNRRPEFADAVHPTESLVERFGLFTIIVLGEVVVGVVNGVSEVERTFETLVVAFLALNIGFGFWWNYFDFVGGRVPRRGRSRAGWVFGHLPLGLGISAAGAGMEGLVAHAGDGLVPEGTAWLLGGSTALVAVSIAGLSLTIDSHPARRAVPATMLTAAAGALIIAAIRPTPWLFGAVLVGLLLLVWLEGFVRHRRHGIVITDGV